MSRRGDQFALWGETGSASPPLRQGIVGACCPTSAMAVSQLWPWSPGRKRRGSHRLRLEAGRRIAIRNDEEIALSAREFRLLDYLMQHEGEICSGQELSHAFAPG